MRHSIFFRAFVFVGFSFGLAAFLISVEAYEAVFEFTRTHENWELDELILVAIAAFISGTLWLVAEVYMKILEVRSTAREMQEKDRELELVKRQRAMNTLAGGLAHSGNNMLQPILTLSRISLKQLDDDHPVRSNLTRVIAVAEQAAELFRNVDSFSREHVESIDQTDIAKILNSNMNVVSLSVPPSADLDIKVNCETAKTALNLPEITDILLVLLSNAVDSLEGHAGQISIELDADPDRITLTVSDTGHGMTADVLEHITEPFFTTKQPGAGTGLGLYIIRSLVDRVGGDISVESELGLGSKFTLRFPHLT
ncbi:ATP-binding protein [Nisaea sp.]|uniref:sensor histidine kinase n=1 Tax=Nisaea sp. TaxID=2024842 RepID=UPI0032ED7F10